jgi:hypothetical protein
MLWTSKVLVRLKALPCWIFCGNTSFLLLFWATLLQLFPFNSIFPGSTYGSLWSSFIGFWNSDSFQPQTNHNHNKSNSRTSHNPCAIVQTMDQQKKGREAQGTHWVAYDTYGRPLAYTQGPRSTRGSALCGNASLFLFWTILLHSTLSLLEPHTVACGSVLLN